MAANWANLKSSITNAIRTNDNQEITGQLLQNVLNNVVSSVGENATFAGIATLTTNPGTPDGPVFYLATEVGTYPNFSGITVSKGEAVILQWKNGAWAKNITGFTSQDAVSWTSYNYIALTNPQLVKIKTNSKALTNSQSADIEVEFTSDTIAVINAYGERSKEFGEIGKTFTIPRYKTLLYNLDTDKIEVDILPHNTSRKVVLLHNEAGKIGSGVLAVPLLHRLIEQKVPYHVVSNITVETSSIIKYSDRYASFTGNKNLYVSQKIKDTVLYFDNGVQFTLDFSGLEVNNGYITIPQNSSLIYDINDGTTKITSFQNVSSEVIVLIHNEGSTIGGLLAPYFEYDANDISVSNRHHPKLTHKGQYINYNTELPADYPYIAYSDKIRLKAGDCLLLNGYCAGSAAAIIAYEAGTDKVVGKVKGFDETIASSYAYYNIIDVDIIISAHPSKLNYYNILTKNYKISTGNAIREFADYMLNGMIISPLSSINVNTASNKSLIVNVSNTETFNCICPPYNQKYNLQLTAGSYTIPVYYTLVYYIDSNSTAVIDSNAVTGKAIIVLAHNENGKVSYGLFADYLNAILEDKKINDTNPANRWNNKKMLCIGDSITAQGYYVNSLSELLGTIVYNRGVEGTTVADSNVADSFCERLDKPSDNTLMANNSGFPTEADLVIIFGGVNDWGRLRNQNLGTFNAAVDRTTFYGAWHYLLRGVKSKYPNAVICILNLHHVYKHNSFDTWHELEYNNPENETEGWVICKNNNNNTYEDYRNAIEKVATFYGCHIIDLANCGMSFLNSTDRNNYTTDGLHPNEAGGVAIAKYIAAQLNSIA